MVRLDFLSGKVAGTHWVARHFPVHIGRNATCGLRLEENGVWDQHVELNFDPAEGFLLKAHANALVMVNNQTVQTARLRNGDFIALGSVQIRFWLGAAHQRGLWMREWLIWLLIVAIPAAQIILIYQLLKQ